MADLDLELLLRLEDRATGALNKSLGRIDKQSKKSTRSISSLGTALRRHWIAATVAIGGMLFVMKNILKASIDFEDAFAGVRKTVDATEKEFAQLNTSLREMALTIPVAVTELAEIQTIAGQLGVRGVKNLTKFTETIAKIAVTTNLTRESAATNFARIANVMQEPLENVDRMGAAIVELGNNFATTEAEIANFATRIAGASRVVGLSTADIFGIGAAFTSVGVRAERGGTAVSKALILISTAAAEGGEALEEFAAIAGLTSQEFATAFEEDAARAFALFIEGLGKAGRRGANILKELELGDQRLVQAFLSVGGASGILTRAVNQANEAFEKNEALVEEAAKRFGTTASQIKLFTNNLNDLNISIGENFIPTLNRALPALSRFIEKLGTLANEGLFPESELPIDTIIPIEKIQEAQMIFEETMQGMTGISEEFLAFNTEIWNQYGRLIDVTLEGGVLAYKTRFAEIQALVAKQAAEQAKTQKKLTTAETKVQTKASADTTKQKSKELQTRIQMTQSFMSSLSQTANMAAAQNKKFAVLAKGVNIAEAIMNTAVGVTKALAQGGIFGPVLAAGIAALGAAQVALIAGQEFHKGGMIRAHDGLAVDEVPIIAQRGEGILSRRGMAALGGADVLNDLNAGGGGGSGMSINIENASFREDQDVEDVATVLAEVMEEQRRARV